jgi:hypothetical protein
MESGSNEIKMYSDFKSPYAYLAFDPGMALSERFDVSVRWIPFQLRLKGKGERSVYSEYKVKYSYMDARRWAKARGLWIRGPLKIYDTTPAAIGGLFAEKYGRFLDYGRAAFKHFFLRCMPRMFLYGIRRATTRVDGALELIGSDESRSPRAPPTWHDRRDMLILSCSAFDPDSAIGYFSSLCLPHGLSGVTG